MNNKNLSLKNNLGFKNSKTKQFEKLSKRFDKILPNIISDVQKENKTLNVLNKNIKLNFEPSELNKFKKYKTIVIIGMGGSILGAEAIYSFLEIKIKKKIYFFNDLDENKILNFKKKENLSRALFIVISKSGNTIETLSNTFALNIIKKNSKNIIIISERKNNFLSTLSKKLKIFYIEHKNYIGGRYSVLSEVGLIPAHIMGINIIKLRSEILYWLKKKNHSFLKDSTVKIALYIHSKKINNLVFLNYFPKLEKFLYWSQQLIAESLGKKGKGLFPVISNVPKDHHSLLQLYLDGPKDKLFNIFSFEKKSKIRIQIDKNLDFMNFLDNKNLSTIKKAQKDALIKTLSKKNIPFREFKIKSTDEQVLGKLFSLFILETIIIGKLVNVNPFNQPAVEQVKNYTKQLLT